MRFKKWFYFTEAIDQNTEKALSYQKQRVDPKEFDDFIDQLKNEPEFIDIKSAFAKLQDKFPILRKEKSFPEAPTDPFFKKYYDQLTSVPKQITKPEYDTLLFFKDKSQDLLTSMMQSLRNLIQEKKIDFNFINNIPTIVYQKKAIPIEDFTQFTGKLHEIEGQDATKPSNNNLADPFFLEVFHKEKLVAKSADKTIWVFKATGPLDCRLMGKGQSWCISSSSSAQWYFNYRHEQGQTQYFIFDFNKDEKDPARYVNPGIAPEGKYSEWVDTSNRPGKINGYSSVEEYKNYLKDKGIDIGVFVADPLTEEEKLLKQLSEEYKKSDTSKKNKIFQEFKEGQYKELFDKFIETMSFLNIVLPEEHFDQLSDQQKKLYLSHISVETLYIFMKTLDREELTNQIFPLVKDNLDADMVGILLNFSSNKDELTNQIFPFIKDKLDVGMVRTLLNISSNKDEMINRIFPFIKDKLDVGMVRELLDFSYFSSNRDELINQILPFVKDKLDGDMVGILLNFSSNKDEMINRIFPFIKDKLDGDMVGKLLHHSSSFDEYSDEYSDEMIKQIFPLVKDKLNVGMVEKLLEYSSEPDELIKQIFPLVKDKLDVKMVRSLLRYSENREELINQIFPYVEDKLDPKMISSLTDYSSNPDKLRKRIDDMKFGAKEQDEI